MPLTVVHAADVHLDRAFTDRGLRLTGRERRNALHDAFFRIVDLARTADALCIAGDLYEHEHVTGDTENMLVSKLGELPCPVLLLPGNHDPHLPGSLYERAAWPDNVHVFRTLRPEPFELSREVVVWGIAYTARELRPDIVRSFRAPGDGRVHLLLLHGSLVGSFLGAESDHLPVTDDELAQTGAAFVMLGHFHGGIVRGNACYPGSPEPFNWGERGLHGVNLLTIDAADVRSDLRPINKLSFDELELDVTGATSGAVVEEQIRKNIETKIDPGRTLRVVLTGEIDQMCEINSLELGERCEEGFADVLVDDRTVPAFNLQEIALEQTVRGRFVSALLKRAEENPDESARALAAARTGLRALDGRTDLVGLAIDRGGLNVD